MRLVSKYIRNLLKSSKRKLSIATESFPTVCRGKIITLLENKKALSFHRSHQFSNNFSIYSQKKRKFISITETIDKMNWKTSLSIDT